MQTDIASAARRVAEDIRIGRHSLPDDLDAIRLLLDAVAAGPGDDRVERVARALCVASGHADPDEPYADAPMWRRWEAQVRFVLALALADAEAAARTASEFTQACAEFDREHAEVKQRIAERRAEMQTAVREPKGRFKL